VRCRIHRGAGNAKLESPPAPALRRAVAAVRRLGCAALVCLLAGTAHAQDGLNPGDPDPLRQTRYAEAALEYLNVADGSYQSTLTLRFAMPVSGDAHTGFLVELPLVRTDVPGRDDLALGDATVKLIHGARLSSDSGIVFTAGLDFDTASEVEAGTGKNVFEGSVMYARFFESGAVLAPAILQTVSLWGRSDRRNVTDTQVDLYYIPRLKDPSLTITVDPAVYLDWVSGNKFVSLAVTVARTLGHAFGGEAELYVKPSLYAGAERPAHWGVEVGCSLGEL
jgi:hypothetical protein